MALILWGLLELTARELKASAKAAAKAPQAAARGPLAYAQRKAPAHVALTRAASDQSAVDDSADEAGEMAVQEVKRLRMAGAI
jgi:hypothetical protein